MCNSILGRSFREERISTAIYWRERDKEDTEKVVVEFNNFLAKFSPRTCELLLRHIKKEKD
jgi:hypothetical protein